MNEAVITINGTRLTEAQAMTVRVAIENMSMTLRDREVAAATGAIGSLYIARIREIRQALYGKEMAELSNLTDGHLPTYAHPDGYV